MSLVERIAIALWRQKRLVRTESAEIELQQITSQTMTLFNFRTTLKLDSSDTRFEKEWSGLESFKSEHTTDELLEYIHLLQNAMDEKLVLKDAEQKYPFIYEGLKDFALSVKQKI